MKKIICSIIFALFSILAFANQLDCENAVTTIEINICIGQEIVVANHSLSQYILKAKERYTAKATVIALIDQSQQDWLVYRQSHCDAVYDIWSDGSIRGVMFGECMLKLTEQRTHQIWDDYLTYMDDTPPLLPEPKQTHH